MKKITVYSKKDCQYCDLAKKYLEARNVEYELIDISDSLSAFKDAFPTVRTVPYILINGIDVGGYTGLIKAEL